MAYNHSTRTFSQYPDPFIFPAPTISLDVPLLTALCAIQGKSGDEGDMQDFITTFLTNQGLSPCSDANGNITCTKGEADAYPTLVAHMDTVHQRYKGYGVALNADSKVLYAYADTAEKVDADKPFLSVPAYRAQVGVGGDDRCGIYVALHLLTLLPAAKAAFFVEEEIGMQNGSRFVDMGFFADAAIVLQCDRKGHDDWVQTVSGTEVSGNDFISSIKDLLTHHRYTVTQHGGPTDVGALKSRGLSVVAANMSCGYYDPHMATETIFLPALENTLNLCSAVLERVGYVKQLHVKAVANYSRYTSERNTYSQNFRRPTRTPQENGWTWASAAAINAAMNTDVEFGGFFKSLPNGEIVGPKSWAELHEVDAAIAAEQALAKAGEDAATTKKARKDLKAWIKADGTWEYVRTGAKGEWVKYLQHKEDTLLYHVAYARMMTDIPEAEGVFQMDWVGCLELDGNVAEDNEDGVFDVKRISRYAQQLHAEEEEEASNKQDKQLSFEMDNVYCPKCKEERAGNYSGVNKGRYCRTCEDYMDFVPKADLALDIPGAADAAALDCTEWVMGNDSYYEEAWRTHANGMLGNY